MTLSLKFGNLDCHFKVDSCGGLTHINKIPESSDPFENLSELAKKCCLGNWEIIQHQYNQAIKAMGNILNWIPPQNEGEISTAFTLWVASGSYKDITQLNLSNRNIKRLPPQMQLFKNLEVLDVSDNQLLSLPPVLEQLPLKKFDISGNICLQIRLKDYEWLQRKTECIVLAYRIRLGHLPKGFSPVQIKCEIDFSNLDNRGSFICDDEMIC